MNVNEIKEYPIASLSSKRTATILNYGCILKSFNLVLKNKSIVNCVLSHKNTEDYVKDTSTYMGSFVGRFCGRIKNSRFQIDNREYNLVPNDGSSHLHGVLSRVLFKLKKHTTNEVVFEYDSPSGEDGFPGNMHIEVQYIFENENLVFRVNAISDQDTVFAPSNHTYFTLPDNGDKSILRLSLQMNASSFYEIDDGILKTGKLISLKEYPQMDFRDARVLKYLVDEKNRSPQLIKGNGLDHTVHFNDKPEIVLESPVLKLSVTTSENNIHVYAGGSLLDSDSYNENGEQIENFDGIAFESEVSGLSVEPNIIKKNKPFSTYTSWYIEEK